MNKKILIPAVLFVVVVVGAIIMLAKNNGNNQPPKPEPSIVLFYGDGCPHCAIVDKFIEENKIIEKVAFEKKEVFNNKTNAEELADRVKTCGLSTDSMGVPFLWDGSQCLIGDQDIINFFKQKIGQ